MKSTPNSGRARRHLSFANLPYHGKCFYLDIKNSSLKTRLQRKILDLGGQIENFLSKDVSLLITEKIEEKGVSKPDFQISVGKQNIPLSRGQALLHASKTQPANRGHTNDILQNAANMGIKMETASQFLRTSTKLLSKFKADKKIENEDAMLGMSPLSWDSKEKENAYVIKVEDNEKLYRPLFKQFDDIPKISYNETGSPFDVGVVLVKQSDNNQSAKKKPAGRVLKGGYCESCDHWYRCTLREHLSSNKHKEFVGKIDNFKNLEIVSDDLPSFSEFLKHNKQNPLSKSCENTKTYLSNDSNNNKINCQPEEVKEGLFDHPELGLKINKQFAGKPQIVDGSTIESFTQGNNSNCVRSEVNDLTENVCCTRTDSRGNSNENCISNKQECHTSSDSSTTHLVTNMTRDSVGLENDDSESYHDTCNGLNRLNHQSQSNKTDIQGPYGVPEVASVCGANISEANFSSSSCSFGDNGVRNALSILQTNISDNSNSSHGRLSADIFFKNVNGLEYQGKTMEDVIEKSEISLELVVSGNNENALHTPTFDKFLKGRDNVVNETEEMPVLFQVEDLSENDIENGMTHMPVIDKHTPPSQMQKQSVNDLGLALEGISDTTQKELIIKNGTFHEPCKLPSDLSLNSLRDSNKTGTVDFESVLHTPRSKFGSKLAEEFNEKVQNSGSTITSVRNWLLPNGDKDSVYSAVSATKINDTLVASEDVGVDEEKELEQLTESEQKQQNLVANWIQTQEFGTSSENPSAALADTDINVLQNLETPNKESELQDNLSSRDITTPISEMYNDQYTDLSSIPTDSYISDREYAQSLEGFSVTKLDTKDKMIENIDGKNQTETSNKGNDICDYNSFSDFADKSVNSHPLTLEASNMNKLQFPEDNKSICNITAASSIDLASGNVCIGSKQKIHVDTSVTLNNSEKVLNDMCTVGNAGLSQNTVVNNNIQCSKEADKISSETTNLNKVNTCNKETKGKKKPVKPKARKARTTKGKSIDSIEKCHTPVSNISCNSASTLPSSAVGTFSSANSHFIQQQGYSPISQSSDNVSQHQFNSSYNMNRVQSPNQSYQQMNGNTSQQFYGQSGVSQGHYNQGQSYYDTGLLPGHNFYSEERHAFYQNNCNMQSQHYGFSGLTDCHGFANQFQQQLSNNVISYSQGSYNGAYINGSVHMNNMNNVNINSNNYVQNVQDFSQVDFLDNSGFSPGASQNTSCVSSPGSFYPAQTLPVQNSPSVPLHVSSQSSQQFSQEFSPVQSNYHVSPQVNHQYSQSQQLYQDSQQNSSHFQQYFPNHHSPAHQVIQEQSQSNQWFLSSPGYTNTSQNLGQVQESAITYETISLNDIAEENCHASQLSFTFGRLKSKENQNLDSVSINRNSAAAKKGRRKTVAEVQMNKTDAYVKTVCHSLNTSNVGYTASNAVVNGILPSVQPLKPSFPTTTDHLQQANYNNIDLGVHQVSNENSDKSYISAKVGDTKIKISKVGNSSAGHGGKKTDLKDYWNVKKTGDCRLVFRAGKRKAEDEEMPVGSSLTPYHESPVQDQRYGGLHEAKKRRCLVY